MASSLPIVRQIKIIYLIPQFIIMGLLVLVFYFIGTEDPFGFGILAYLIISMFVRYAIPVNHRNGMKLIKSGQYDKAILEFEKSYYFFVKYRWVDKYRCIFLLSSSRIAYLEMSLVNMAFCYSQLGQGQKSKEFYEKALFEFPDSQIAKSAINMINAAKVVD